MNVTKTAIINLMYKYGKLSSNDTLRPAKVDLIFLDELKAILDENGRL